MTRKILIAEDEKFLVRVYRAKLEEKGYEVHFFENGEEVYKYAKEHKPDLIILDIMMPNKNGYDTLKELKDDKETEQIPVVILTNLETAEDETKAIVMGAAMYIRKSVVALTNVIEIVENTLKSK